MPVDAAKNATTALYDPVLYPPTVAVNGFETTTPNLDEKLLRNTGAE